MERFLTWLEVNKIRVLTTIAAAGALAVIITAYIQHQSRRETRASHALSEVPSAINVTTSMPPGAIDGYLNVAQQYEGTRAAGRAILMAAAGLFIEADYDKAQAQFDRFLKSYPGSPWTGQAVLGRAKCLDAKKQYAQAEQEYEEIRKRFANTPLADEAALALAQVYEAQKKPEEAIKLYHSLSEAGAGSIGARAGLRKEEMIKDNPALTNSLPQPPPPQVVSTPPSPVPFTLTNFQGQTTPTQAVPPSVTNIIRLTPTTAAPPAVVTASPPTSVTAAPPVVPLTNIIEIKPESVPAPPTNPPPPPAP